MSRGRTSLSGGTLPDKLLSLKPGEFFLLPDPKRHMDRAMQTIVRRSARLDGTKFATTRTQYVEGDRLLPAVKITRVT